MRIAAERLHQKMAAYDQQAHAHPPTPHGPSVPVPFRSRADLQARDRLQQRLLDQANQTLQSYSIPHISFLRRSGARTKAAAKTGAIRALNSTLMR